MKILLVSDSHGYDDELKKVLENVKCDLKIHCGEIVVLIKILHL